MFFCVTTLPSPSKVVPVTGCSREVIVVVCVVLAEVVVLEGFVVPVVAFFVVVVVAVALVVPAVVASVVVSVV